MSMYCFLQRLQDSGNVASLPQFYPKYDKSGIWVTATHIADQLHLLFAVLIWMMMRSSGLLAQ